MDEPQRVSDMARLMQWHPEAQSNSARRAWARGIAKLIANTECDPLFLAVKWGIDRQMVCYWRDLGQCRGVYDQRESTLLMEGWFARSATLHNHQMDVHRSKCPCQVSGPSVDMHSAIYDV